MVPNAQGMGAAWGSWAWVPGAEEPWDVVKVMRKLLALGAK